MAKKSISAKAPLGKQGKFTSAIAPGRMDVIGGIADYSGSLVLEMPILENTKVKISERDDDDMKAYSDTAESLGEAAEVRLPLSSVCGNHEKLRETLAKKKASWAAYVFGCFSILAKAKKAKFNGCDLWISSEVPAGKGVSSSASVEVAVMAAIAKHFKIKLGKTELPILCQKVENLVVGAPCGLMDQLSCYLGESNRLLPILCQPDQVQGSIPIHRDIQFVGIDSGVRHAVSGASYGDVRIAAFMGYGIIAQKLGVKKSRIAAARKSGKWKSLPFGGYLANIAVSEYESQYREWLPDAIKGRDYLKKYGNTVDAVTEIDPAKTYRVANCTRHPIYENHRVRVFSALMKSLQDNNLKPKDRKGIYVELGELMYQAHASYSRCELGNAVTDQIVALARKAGPAQGVYGAKITGGGSGGTVCLLCEGSRGVAVAKKFMSKLKGKGLVFFKGSSQGGYYL